MQSVFLNDILFSNVTVAEFVYYFYYSATLVLFVLLSAISYTFLRPKLPSWVNCWFCNRSFWVPYADRNCFDCRFCDQYNGFTDAGDYNTDVLLRRPTTDSYSPVSKNNKTENTNGLCKSCNLNQQLKVQQLSSFTAMNDDNYDQEIQHFKDQLEKCYKLCDRCSLVLTQTLQTQHYELLAKRLNSHCPEGTSQVPKEKLTRYRARRVCIFGSNLSLVLLLLLTIYESAKEFNVIDPNLKIEGFYLPSGIQISSIGTFFNLLATVLDGKFKARSMICAASMGVVFSLTWIKNPTLLAVATTVTLTIHLLPQKLVLKKLTIEKIPTPAKAEEIANVVKEAIKKTANVPEERAVPVEPKKKAEKPNSVKKTPRMETRNHAKKSHTDRSRLFSPPPEVYEGLSGLRLSSPEPQPRPEPVRPETPQTPRMNRQIIQPAKFSFNGKRATPSPPKNYFTEPLPEMNAMCKFGPCVEYDYGPCSPGFISPMPIGHAAYSYTFTPRPYPYGFPNGRFSPPFFSPFESNNSSPVVHNFSQPSVAESQNNQIWFWLKRTFCVSSIFLNIIAMIYFFDQVWRRMF